MSADSVSDTKGGEPHVRHLDKLGDEQITDWNQVKEGANLATEDEHSMTFFTGCKKYPKAVFWSAMVSLCIIMDGYDTALLGSLFGFPAFQKMYGREVGDTGEYQLAPHWQSLLGLSSNIGNIIGIILNGYVTERFGHKRVVQASLISLTGLVFILFFAPTVGVLLAGQILCGIPWGIFTTLAPSFASEVAPLALRSYLETWVVACWGIGQFISFGVLFSLNQRDDRWAFRIPFAVQWIFPVIILPIISFCPDSPWWLVRKGRYDDAEKSVRRLTSAETPELASQQAKNAVALMIETNNLEKEIDKDTSYLACFKGIDLRRTEIAAAAWGTQVLTGFTIQSYATYFFEQAGLSANNSFKMTLGQGGIHLLCNLASAVLSGKYGRRSLFLVSLLILASFMFVIGGLAFAPESSTIGFATSAIYLIWFGFWCLSIGPLPYVINGEVSSTRLRSKTIAIARGTYLCLGVINAVTAPFILNPDAADWRGKAGLLAGGLTILCFLWAYFRLPETGGRTYEELDVLFSEKNIPARLFSKAVIHREGDVIRVSGPHLKSD